jgi:O-antigen ligase
LAAGIFLGTLSVIQVVFGTYVNNYGGYANSAFATISDESGYRLGGPVADPNYYAQMMLVIVPLALDRLWNEARRIMRWLAVWALSVCSFAVLFTYSRGGFISLVIIILAMIFIYHRGELRYLIAVLTVVLFLANFLPDQFAARIRSLTELVPWASSGSANGVAQDLSLRGRTSENIVALRMFADSPILGVGIGNYPLLYQKYARGLGLEFRSEVRQAHNLYLEIVSETGLLGLFSFGILIWGMFGSIWKSQKSLRQKGLFSTSHMIVAHAFGLLGFLLAAIFLHAVFFRNFWVLAGIALAVPRMAEIEIEKVNYQLSEKI